MANVTKVRVNKLEEVRNIIEDLINCKNLIM